MTERAVVTKRGRNYKPKRGEPRAKDHPIDLAARGRQARPPEATDG